MPQLLSSKGCQMIKPGNQDDHQHKKSLKAFACFQYAKEYNYMLWWLTGSHDVEYAINFSSWIFLYVMNKDSLVEGQQS